MIPDKIFNFQKNKVFVIAEVGFNHEGNLDRCIELITLASKSGADAVKIQIFNPQLNYAKKTESFKVISPASLDEESLSKVFNFAKKKKIKLFSSFGDFDSLEFIRKHKPFCYKISSSTLTHIPLINELSKDNVPIIFSTGIALDKDISNVIRIFKKRKIINKVFILHCLSIYPTPKKYANLQYMSKLRKKYKIPVGYSDHCIGMDAVLGAVNLGAQIIEKHFTFDSNRKGLDHQLSLMPADFARMIKKINDIKLMHGSGKENPKKLILPLRNKYGRCLVALKRIKIGDKLTYNNVGFKRPLGKKIGLDPISIGKIINNKSLKDLKVDDIIDFSVIKNDLV